MSGVAVESLWAANLPEPMKSLQTPGMELVLNIIATCSDPVPTGGSDVKKPARDGVRDDKGIEYPTPPGKEEIYRLQPEFFAPAGKYAWLNKGLFVATLIYPVSPELSLAQGPHENDRLIQVFRVT